MHEPGRLYLGYLGDDFTGSTDVMEALTAAGIRTILFLDPPQPEALKRFKGVGAIGVAVMSRSMSPAHMDETLPSAMRALRALRPSIVHYKTCSTFDSAVDIGSIGQAIDLGAVAFAPPFVPVVVGAPVLGRYCVFGNLFARSGLDSEPFRLDRHPTMRRHPITPMTESDLRVHLGHQTAKRIEVLDALQLSRPADEAARHLDTLLASGAEVVLFDVLYDEHLSAIGRLLSRFIHEDRTLFAAGSSGVEYALTAYARAAGSLPPAPQPAGAGRVDTTVAVSGSCSPVTKDQIDWAVAQGFADVAVETDRLVDQRESERICSAATKRAVDCIREGRSVIVHTSRGPDDPRIERTIQRLEDNGYDRRQIKLECGRILGAPLGRILRDLLRETGLRRAVVIGGDTSGAVARSLHIEALEMVGPMAPGSPLCRAHSDDPHVHGAEIVFKGGQVGRRDFFDSVLRGCP